jgi:hypothetical protein
MNGLTWKTAKIPRNYYINAFIEKRLLQDTIEEGDDELLVVPTNWKTIEKPTLADLINSQESHLSRVY